MPALPAQAPLPACGGFRPRPEERRTAGAMSFSEGVTAGNEGHGLFVIHRHTREGFTDIARSRNGIRLAVGSFRIHIDEAHLHGAERILQLTFAAIAFV